MDNEFADYAGDNFFKDAADNEDSENEREELAIDPEQLMNPKSVRERIDEALETLANFKTRKNTSLSRSDLLSLLSK